MTTPWHARLTLYPTGTNPTQRFASFINKARPRAVEIHTWTPDKHAPSLRAMVPDLVLSCGIGIDGVARRVAKGDQSVTVAVKDALTAVKRAVDCGCERITWNAEAEWKRPPDSEESGRIHSLVRNLMDETAAVYPEIRQEHTAYDHPTYHSTYPWRAWLGPGTKIKASWAQVYAAPMGSLMAHRGALTARETGALSSWATAVKKGWILPDAPPGSESDLADVDWRPYFQAHHVQAIDTVSCALKYDEVTLWAWPERVDDDGRAAAAVLCAADRENLWDVRKLQERIGVNVDGNYGILSHRAALTWAHNR